MQTAIDFVICNYDGVDDMGTGQVRHFRGCEIPDQLLSLWKGLCFSLLGFTKMQIAGSQEIKGSHYLARKVLKLTVSRCSHQDINGTQPESWPKKLKTIQVSLSLPLEILTILSARLHSPGIQRTSLSQIFQLSVVTIQYCRQLQKYQSSAEDTKVGSPCGVFICQHDCYLCRQSGTRL